MSYQALPEFRRAQWPSTAGSVGFYTGESAADRPRFRKPLERPQRRSAAGAAPATGSPPRTVSGELLLAPHLVPLPVLRAAMRALEAGCRSLGIRREKVHLSWLAPPGRFAAFAHCEEGAIYVRADFPPMEVAVSVAHELRHIFQWMNCQEPDEADAERFGQAFRYWGYEPARI